MNKLRRAEIDAVAAELLELQSRIEALRDEEQDAFDNLPGGLQQAPGGQASEAAAAALCTALDGLEEVLDALGEAQA